MPRDPRPGIIQIGYEPIEAQRQRKIEEQQRNTEAPQIHKIEALQRKRAKDQDAANALAEALYSAWRTTKDGGTTRLHSS
jgi:hypothetical protein